MVFVNKVNEVKEYLTSLKWDGVKRVDTDVYKRQLEKRNQAMLKKIRQEKMDKLKAELCCKIYAIIAVVATIFGFGMV